MNVTCPECRHSFNTTPGRQFKRICADCQEPIRVHHKFYLAVENNTTVMRHRHCDNPSSYQSRQEAS